MIRDLGTLGGDSTAVALNERGQVIGSTGVVASSGKARAHAFLWERGRMRDLGTIPGTKYSFGMDINERGQVVGAAWNTPWKAARAFLWQEGKMRDLGPLDLYQSLRPLDLYYPQGVFINDRGQVVGTWCDPSEEAQGENCHAALWEDGKGQVVGGPWSRAFALNGRGQVAGMRDATRDANAERVWHAFLWEKGKTRMLSGSRSAAVAMNERGQVVACRSGYFSDAWDPCSFENEPQSLLWQGRTTHRLGTLGGKWTTPVAINDRGLVVGWSRRKGDVSHAFLWQDGKMRDLGTLGGKWSQAVAINDRGQLVGWSETKGGGEHAFLWQKGTMIDLGTLPGKKYSGATSINNQGWIIGYAANKPRDTWKERGQHAVLWTLKRG